MRKFTPKEIIDMRLQIIDLTPEQFFDVKALFVATYPNEKFARATHSNARYHRFYPSVGSIWDTYGASASSYVAFSEDNPRKAEGTISYDNIDFYNGKPEVSMDEIREAAKAYGINFNF